MSIEDMQARARALAEAQPTMHDDEATEEHVDDRGILHIPKLSTIEGLVVGYEVREGDWGPVKVLTVQDEARGKPLSFYCSGVILSEALADADSGDYVIVQFLGKVLKKSAPKNSTKSTDRYSKYKVTLVKADTPPNVVNPEPVPASVSSSDYDPTNEPF